MRWLTFVFLIMIAGCQYKPEGEYVSPVKPRDESEPVHISLDGYDNFSTIKIYGPLSSLYFHFSMDVGSLRLKATRITAADDVLYEGKDKTGTFRLPSYPTSRSITLKIEFQAGSNTGSLADLLDAEDYVVWREWTLDIDVDLPAAPTFTQAVDQGYSSLQWTAYDRPNFVRYELTANYGTQQTTWTTTNPTVTRWTDSLYAGGYTVTYYLRVINSNGTTGRNISYLSPISFTANYNATDSTVTVVTSPVIFTHVFQKFRFTESISGIQAEITDPAETTKTFKINQVGYHYTTFITGMYIHSTPNHFKYSHFYELNTSPVFPRLGRLMTSYHFNATLHEIIGLTGTGPDARLIRMNPDTFEAIDSVNIVSTPSYYVPYFGVYAYYSNPKNLVQVDLVSHATVSYNTIPVGFGSGPAKISAGSNQYVAYSWLTPDNGATFYDKVYNMSTGQSNFLRSNLLPTTQFISHDGEYFRDTEGRMFKLAGTSWQLQSTSSFTGTLLGYRPDRSDEFIAVNGSTDIKIYDSATGLLKRSIPQKGIYLGYDAPTKNLAFYNSAEKRVYLVDIDTLQYRFYAFYFDSQSAIPRLVNGTLIMTYGDYMKLQ